MIAREKEHLHKSGTQSRIVFLPLRAFSFLIEMLSELAEPKASGMCLSSLAGSLPSVHKDSAPKEERAHAP